MQAISLPKLSLRLDSSFTPPATPSSGNSSHPLTSSKGTSHLSDGMPRIAPSGIDALLDQQSL
jgi:hypothetical protein